MTEAAVAIALKQELESIHRIHILHLPGRLGRAWEKDAMGLQNEDLDISPAFLD